jgi:hypothetical protein
MPVYITPAVLIRLSLPQGSPTLNWKPMLGPALVLTPNNVIDAWIKIWTKSIGTGKGQFQMELLPCHGQQSKFSEEDWDRLKGTFNPARVETELSCDLRQDYSRKVAGTFSCPYRTKDVSKPVFCSELSNCTEAVLER